MESILTVRNSTLTIAACFCLVGTGCDQLTESPEAVQEESGEVIQGYPIPRGLTDNQGRTIDAVITGRSSGQVAFYSRNDPSMKVYLYPIRQLDASSRKLVHQLPIGGDLNQNADTALNNSLMKREIELREMDQEIREMARGLRATGITHSQYKLLQGKLKRKREEYARLETRYNELKADQD